MIAIRQADLPERFVKEFRPVIAKKYEKGLPRYVFDCFGLEFFRRMTTGEPVSPRAIWSVVPFEGLQLNAGECEDAVGYVVAEVPRTLESPSGWSLPRRLTARQRLRRDMLIELRRDIATAQFDSPTDVVRLIDRLLDSQSV